MAKGQNVTPEMELEIWILYQDLLRTDPDIAMKDVMHAYHVKLGTEKSKTYTWPGLAKVQQVIRDIKAHPPSLGDAPWSIFTTRNNSVVSPEDLPVVLQAWVYAREHLGTTFTVRNAKWVARLRYLVKDPANDIGDVVRTALGYSLMEIYEEIVPAYRAGRISFDLDLYKLYTGDEIAGERLKAFTLAEGTDWLSREAIEKNLQEVLQNTNKEGK